MVKKKKIEKYYIGHFGQVNSLLNDEIYTQVNDGQDINGQAIWGALHMREANSR